MNDRPNPPRRVNILFIHVDQMHYLVDDQGRVQLITKSTVNWALNAMDA